MSLCQRTNGRAPAQIAIWLNAHRARLLVDGPDWRFRYLLVPDGDHRGQAVATYRTPAEFSLAIETPGGVPWPS